MQEINQYIERVTEHFTTEQAVYLNACHRGEIDREEFQDKVRKYISSMGIHGTAAKEVLEGFTAYIWNFDALEGLVMDNTVTDIHCLGYRQVRIKRIINNKAVRQRSSVRFMSSRHYRRFIQHLAIRNKVNLSEQHAIQHFVDKFTNPDYRLRCNIITEFLTCTEEPYLHIRKEAKRKRSVEELEACGMFDSRMKDILLDAVNGSIIVSGASGSGKTAFMNAFMERIGDGYNGLIIQTDDELFSAGHPELLPVHTIERRGENGSIYTLKELARNGMLIDKDYLIFGEVKGGEARYAFTAANTGHRTWLSLHAPNTRSSLYKFADYIKFESDMKLEDIFRMLGDTSFLLLHMTDFRIDGMTRVKGFDEQKKGLLFEDVIVEG